MLTLMMSAKLNNLKRWIFDFMDKGETIMNAELREIYEVLIQNPDIANLFHVLISLPEDKRDKACSFVLKYLQERQ